MTESIAREIGEPIAAMRLQAKKSPDFAVASMIVPSHFREKFEAGDYGAPAIAGIFTNIERRKSWMTKNHRPAFKASQIYDWHTEPKEVRGSSFFHETSFGPTTLSGVETRAVKRRVNAVVVAIIMTAFLGIVGMFGLVRFLHS
jgi:hypothetical protein